MRTDKKTVKNVIEDWMNGLNDIVEKQPFMSFSLIATGIEFLGKCLDYKTPWNQTGLSEIHFKYAVHKLDALKEYRQYTPVKPFSFLKNEGMIGRAVNSAQYGNPALVNDNSNLNTAISNFQRAHQPPIPSVDNDNICKALSKLNSNLHRIELTNELLQIADSDVSTARTSLDNISSNLQLTTPQRTVDMYTQIRCGLVHCAMPGKDFLLSAKVKWPLYSDGKVYVLDANDFLAKYQSACAELFAIRDTNIQNRLEEEYMVVYYPEDQDTRYVEPDIDSYYIPDDAYINPYVNGISASPPDQSAMTPRFPYYYTDTYDEFYY